jgi:hypothetical protein
MSFKERLEQLEASHIKLMTDHELFVKEQEAAWEKNRENWERHDRWQEAFDAQRAEDRKEEKRRGEELDKRIAKLVSGIGEFISKEKRS